MGGRKAAYAVIAGTVPGVYDSWEEAAEKVVSVPRSVFKGYSTVLEARRAYRDALLAGRVKVIKVDDPGPGANLDDPEYTVPPPLASSSSSSKGSSNLPRNSTATSGNSSGGHTVRAATTSAPVTGYSDRPAPSHQSRCSQSRKEREGTALIAGGSSRHHGPVVANNETSRSPPTVGTVQNALNNLSVSSDRRRRRVEGGEAQTSDTISANPSSANFHRRHLRYHHHRRSNDGTTTGSRSIVSSPPTRVTQLEGSLSNRSISPVESRRSKSSASSSRVRETRHTYSSPLTGISYGGSLSLPAVSAAYTHSSRSRRSSSNRSLRSNVEKHIPRGGRHGQNSHLADKKPARLSYASYSANTGFSRNNSHSRAHNPSWSPKTDVTYIEDGESSSHSAHCSAASEGFITAPSSPDISPITPLPVGSEIGAALMSSPAPSISSLVSSPQFVNSGWSSDRVRLISSPELNSSSNGRHSNQHLPKRTYAETGIQTEPPPAVSPQFCQCHCHQCHFSDSQSLYEGDTAPITPVHQTAHLPLASSVFVVDGRNALGLSQSMHLPSLSHDPALDPRSPIGRSTSLPASAPAFGRPSPRPHDPHYIRSLIHRSQ